MLFQKFILTILNVSFICCSASANEKNYPDWMTPFFEKKLAAKKIGYFKSYKNQVNHFNNLPKLNTEKLPDLKGVYFGQCIEALTPDFAGGYDNPLAKKRIKFFKHLRANVSEDFEWTPKVGFYSDQSSDWDWYGHGRYSFWRETKLGSRKYNYGGIAISVEPYAPWSRVHPDRFAKNHKISQLIIGYVPHKRDWGVVPILSNLRVDKSELRSLKKEKLGSYYKEEFLDPYFFNETINLDLQEDLKQQINQLRGWPTSGYKEDLLRTNVLFRSRGKSSSSIATPQALPDGLLKLGEYLVKNQTYAEEKFEYRLDATTNTIWAKVDHYMEEDYAIHTKRNGKKKSTFLDLEVIGSSICQFPMQIVSKNEMEKY